MINSGKSLARNQYGLSSPFMTAVNYLFIFILVLLVLGPFLIVIFLSLKSAQEYATSPLFALPENFLYLENFYAVLTQQNSIMLTGFKNSLIIILVSVFLSILTGTMAAYVLDRFDFRFKKIILALFFLAVLIPKETTHVATFGIINKLGLFNTMGAPILLYIGTDIIQLMIFMQFINKIPVSIDESARIDGANYFRIFRQMILPLMKPAITTTIIIKSVWVYNDMFIPYLYMPKGSLAVVSTALMRIGTQASGRLTDWPLMSAAVIITILPTLTLFFVFQKNIISGLSMGSIK